MTGNITCPRCRHRHPAKRSCEEAKRLADAAALERSEAAARTAGQAVREAEVELVEAFAGELGSGTEECYAMARNIVAKISALITAKTAG